jgi:hypothetical protein
MTLSFPAQAGNPVRGSLSINHYRLGVLDRPVKPDDDIEAVVTDTPSQSRAMFRPSFA